MTQEYRRSTRPPAHYSSIDSLLRATHHAKEGKLEDALLELKSLLAREPRHLLALGMQAAIQW